MQIEKSHRACNKVKFKWNVLPTGRTILCAVNSEIITIWKFVLKLKTYLMYDLITMMPFLREMLQRDGDRQ